MCKGLSIDDVGVSRDTVFQEKRPGAVFETGDFVKEKLGGLPQNDSGAVIHMRESRHEVPKSVVLRAALLEGCSSSLFTCDSPNAPRHFAIWCKQCLPLVGENPTCSVPAQ